jgi:hypothetical protein
MPDWVQLKRLLDELDALTDRQALTIQEFTRVFAEAETFAADAPQVLESFIRRAPSEWLDQQLFQPTEVITGKSASAVFTKSRAKETPLARRNATTLTPKPYTVPGAKKAAGKTLALKSKMKRLGVKPG